MAKRNTTTIYMWEVRCYDDKGVQSHKEHVHLDTHGAGQLKEFLNKKHALVTMQKLGIYKHKV